MQTLQHPCWFQLSQIHKFPIHHPIIQPLGDSWKPVSYPYPKMYNNIASSFEGRWGSSLLVGSCLATYMAFMQCGKSHLKLTLPCSSLSMFTLIFLSNWLPLFVVGQPRSHLLFVEVGSLFLKLVTDTIHQILLL